MKKSKKSKIYYLNKPKKNQYTDHQANKNTKQTPTKKQNKKTRVLLGSIDNKKLFILFVM